MLCLLPRRNTGAALELKRANLIVHPHILLPSGLCSEHEVAQLTQVISKASDDVCAQAWVDSDYNMPYVQCTVGCVLDTPRACLRAAQIANSKYVGEVQFDLDALTQLTFGMGKEESDPFMVSYVDS